MCVTNSIDYGNGQCKDFGFDLDENFRRGS